MGDRSDADLMVEAVASPAAFLHVYERHAPTILRFLTRRVGPDVGEDLLSETFRIAFERRAAYNADRDSALPWLYGIGANLIRHHHRSEERRLRAMGRVRRERRDAVPAPSGAESRETLAAVADLVARLPDGEREVLLMVAFEELTYEMTAAALGIPVGTVRSRLNRARSRLRELLNQDWRAPIAHGRGTR